MERERTMRRVLSVILAVLMLVTSVPMDTVYAEELTNTNTMTVAPDNLEEQNLEKGGRATTASITVAHDAGTTGATVSNDASGTWDLQNDLVYTITNGTTVDYDAITVTFESTTLTKDTDYTVDSSAGTVKVLKDSSVLSGQTTGTIKLTLSAKQSTPPSTASITVAHDAGTTGATVSNDASGTWDLQNDLVYTITNGTTVDYDAITVTFESTTLTKDTDYTVDSSAGTVKVLKDSSVLSGQTTGTVKLTLSAKQSTPVAATINKPTVTCANNADQVAGVKLQVQDNSSWVDVKEDQTYTSGQGVKVVPTSNYFKVKSVKLNDNTTGVNNDVVTLAAGENNIAVELELDPTKVVVVNIEGDAKTFTAKLGEKTFEKTHAILADTTAQIVEIKAKDYYQITVTDDNGSVNAETDGSYKVEIPASSDLTSATTLKVIKVTVTATQGYTLSISETAEATAFKGVYTTYNKDATSGNELTNKITDSTFIAKSNNSTVVYLAVKDTSYKVLSAKVTTGKGTPVDRTSDLRFVTGVPKDNETIFSLDLGVLSDNTKLDIVVVKKSGYTVDFKGANYTANVYDKGQTSNSENYKEGYPFVDNIADNQEKEITLTAADNYRFTSIALDNVADKDIVIADGGKTATISGLTKDTFKDAENNTLTLTAEVEKTVTLTIPVNAADYSVVVEENYDYHLDTDGKNDNIVDKVTDTNVDNYTVGTDKDITVTVTLTNGKQKVSAMTIKANRADAKDSTLEFTDVTKNDDAVNSYEATVSNLAENSTIAIKVADDESKLQGIVFAKGHYTVADSDNRFVITDFKTIDESLGGILKLSTTELTANDTVTLTITPDNGYSLGSIRYDDETLFEEGNNDLTLPTGITVTEDNKAVTVTIKGTVLEKGKQQKLEVDTKTVAITDSEISGATNQGKFSIAYGADQYIDNNAKLGVFFSPAEELIYTVSANGKLKELTTKVDGKDVVIGYELLAGAETVSFNVIAPNEVAVSLSFKDANNNDIAADRNGNTFTIAAKALLDVKTITLDGEVETENISFTYRPDLVDLEVKGLYKTKTPEAVKDEEGNDLKDGRQVVTFAVRKGKTLEVSATAKFDEDVTGAKRYFAEITGASGHGFTAEKTSFILTANAGEAGQKLEIAANALEKKAVLDTQKKAIEVEDDGSYIISYGPYYYAFVYQGADKAAANKAELVVDGVAKAVTVEDNQAKFRVDQSAAGKQVVLNLKNVTTVDGKETEDAVASFTFTVAESLKSVSVAGVKDGKLTQTIDTKVSYAITLPEGTSINDLSVDASGKVDAEINKKTSELVVTTTAEKAAEKAGTIELSNRDGLTLQKIVVDTTAVAGVAEAEVNITAIASTSDSLLVKLEAKGVADVDLVNGHIAYKVNVSKQSGSKGPSVDNKEFYVVKDGDAQEATLKIIKDASTAKNDGKYDVTVQLVQLNGKVEDNKIASGTKAIYESKVVSKKGTDEFVTKVPYYTNAEELVLKNQVNTIGQGQKLQIADVDFGDKTSYITNAKVTLLDAKGEEVGTGDYRGFVEYKKLYLEAYSTLALGNYTVVVSAEVPTDEDGNATAVAATASMNIKVESGVWDVEITNVPTTLFKADKKEAKIKAGVVFNTDAKAKVKNKKVTWELFKSVETENNEYKFTPITEKDNLYGYVTIKNGMITVNKDYKVSPNASKNTFVVVATSEANPEACGYATVEVTTKGTEISDKNLLLAEEKYDADGTFVGYAPLKDQTTVSSDLAASGNLYLIAVKAGLEQSAYKAEDLISASFSTKVSNKKLEVVGTQDDPVKYKLTSRTTMKNVKITVTAMDGSKASAQKTFNIDYANMDNMVMQVAGVVVNGSYKFAGTSEDTLTVRLGYKDENGKFQNFAGVLNAKVAVKGGKILSSDLVDNEYVVKLNKAEATISVSNKALKGAEPMTCVITNTAYTTVAAPNVVADVKQINANSIDAQKMTFSFKKAADYKFVKVQIDIADKIKLANKDNKAYVYFANAFAGGYDSKIIAITDGTFALDFAENRAIPAGAYKLYFSYGNYDASGNFIPATKAGKVTVKAVEATKVEYTANTQYTMSLLDTAVVELTGVAGKNTTVKYPDGNALSTIVDGKANNFGKFFEVKDGMLALKDADELGSEAVKALQKLVGAQSAADLTGYVQYRANGNKNLKQVKVTVTLSKEALKKYAASDVSMLAGSGVSAPVEITADGKAVTVKAAAVTKGSFKAPTELEEGKVTITSTSKPSVGSNTVTLKVLPSTSFYKDNAKTNGVEVNVNVDAKASHSPVISMKDLSVAFDGYDGEKEVYIGKVPYTSNIANTITKIDVTTKDLGKYIKFTAENGEIVAKVEKDNLDSAVEKGLLTYGETKNIDVTVTYCGGLVKENYTFEVSFPGAASFEKTDLQTIFTNIRKAVWNDPASAERLFPGTVDFSKALEAKVKADEQFAAEATDHTKSTKMYTEATKLYKEAAEAAVKAAVEAELVVGADVALTKVEGTYDAKNAADTLSVVITLKGASVVTDNTVENITGTKEYQITTTVAGVPVNSDLMAIYKASLTKFAAGVATNNTVNGEADGEKLSNAIDEATILAAAREAVKVADSYRIVAVNDSWEMTPATSGKAGSFTLKLQVRNVSTSKESGEVTVTGAIDALQTAADAATAFNAKFTALKAGTLDGYSILNVSTSKEDILAIANSVITNSSITVNYKENEKETDKNEFKLTEKVVKITQEDGTTTEDVTVYTGIEGVLLFTDESTGQAIAQSATAEFDNVNISTGKVDTWISSKNALKNSVNQVIGSNTLAKPYLTNDSDASKAAILKAATQAIENAPYVVEINDWTFTAPTTEKNGSVTYTVSFKALEGATEVTDTLTLDQTIDKDDKYQSFEEAVEAIKGDFVQKAFDPDWKKTVGTENVAGTANILTFIRKSVKDGYDASGADDSSEQSDGRYLEVVYLSVVDDYFTKYEDACKLVNETVNKSGSLTLTVVLNEHIEENGTDKVVNTQEITLRKEIEATSQTFADAVQAVKDLENTFSVTKNTTSTDVEAAIKLVIKTSDFTAKVKSDSFKNNNGSVTCTIVVTDRANGTTEDVSW